MAKGFIVYPGYKVEQGRAYIYFYGRLENGESFLAIKYSRPYFFIKEKDKRKALKEADVEVVNTDFRNFENEKVSKVILDNPKDVPKVKNMLLDNSIVCYEADIRFVYRYLIDNDIKGSIEIKGEYEKGEYVDRIYNEPEIKAVEYIPTLKVLSIDIETDKEGKDLYSIALYSENLNKVLLLKEGKYRNAETFKNEKELLERFKDIIYEEGPDVITGWNFIDFDLRILRDLFKKNNVSFTLGRGEEETRLRISDNFFRESSVDCEGRAVLDGLHLMRTSFIKMDDYKLSTAAKQILKDDKLITGENRFEEIERCYKEEPQKLVNYNLKDAKLAYDIAKKSKTIELTVRRTMLTRMQLDRVDASIASLDSLYLKELQKRKIVAPTNMVEERTERIIGGYVMSSKPGIYDNIIILDFKSLYPSIIRTFNIDPLSYLGKKVKEKDKKKVIEAPNKVYFKNENGILPQILEGLLKHRNEVIKKKDELSSYAIKILMNSMFGVLANPACRFYSLDMANAITHFGQKLIKLCAKELENKGYEIIYQDTDSNFLNPKIKDYKRSISLGEELEKEMNKFFKDYIKKDYVRESKLELEFEKVYKKLLMPMIRHGEEGAKKRYAGLIEKNNKDEIEFVGLEVVRRDWTDLAKKFQREIVERIFKEKQIASYIKRFIEDLRNGKYDKLSVYRKAIRKSVKEYTKTTPPHIKAAKKAGIKRTGLIEYVYTVNGPEVASLRKSKIDYEHYIEKQLKPIADAVLVFFDKKFDDLVKGNKQSSLLEF